MENISEIAIVDSFIGKCIFFFGVSGNFLLRSGDGKSPLMAAFDIVFQPQTSLFFRSLNPFNKFDKSSFKFSLIDLFFISFLRTIVHLLSYIQQLLDHILTDSITSFSIFNLIISLKQSIGMKSFVNFFFMFLSLDFQQLFLFKFSIDISHFAFLLDFVFMKVFVLCDYFLVLPCSPYFVLNLFLLPRCLLNCAYNYPLSPGYLYHLISLLLLNYHFSSSLLSLVSSSLSLGCSDPPLFSYLLPRLRANLGFLHIFS